MTFPMVSLCNVNLFSTKASRFIPEWEGAMERAFRPDFDPSGEGTGGEGEGHYGDPKRLQNISMKLSEAGLTRKDEDTLVLIKVGLGVRVR